MKMDRASYLLLMISFFLALLIALMNSYVVNLKGAEVDAERFLSHANDWISNGSLEFKVDAEFFIQFIGLFKLIGLDEFMMTFLGIVAFYAVVIKIFERLDSAQLGFFYILIVYFLLFSPSFLFRVGALLREPYVVLFLTGGIWFMYCYIEKGNIGDLLLGLLCLAFGSLFHKAALAFLPMAVCLVFLLRIKTFSGVLTSLFLFLVVALLLYFVLLPMIKGLRGGQALSVILTGDFSAAERIVSYKSSREFRTTYDYNADWSSLFNVFTTVVQANYYYYFKPFIKELYTFSDVFVFFENMFRAVLVAYSFVLVSKSRSRGLLFLLLAYLSLNVIWALGTSNYGTGTRHHMTSMPLLCLFFACYCSYRKRD